MNASHYWPIGACLGPGSLPPPKQKTSGFPLWIGAQTGTHKIQEFLGYWCIIASPFIWKSWSTLVDAPEPITTWCSFVSCVSRRGCYNSKQYGWVISSHLSLYIWWGILFGDELLEGFHTQVRSQSLWSLLFPQKKMQIASLDSSGGGRPPEESNDTEFGWIPPLEIY